MIKVGDIVDIKGEAIIIHEFDPETTTMNIGDNSYPVGQYVILKLENDMGIAILWNK